MLHMPDICGNDGTRCRMNRIYIKPRELKTRNLFSRGDDHLLGSGACLVASSALLYSPRSSCKRYLGAEFVLPLLQPGTIVRAMMYFVGNSRGKSSGRASSSEEFQAVARNTITFFMIMRGSGYRRDILRAHVPVLASGN